MAKRTTRQAFSRVLPTTISAALTNEGIKAGSPVGRSLISRQATALRAISSQFSGLSRQMKKDLAWQRVEIQLEKERLEGSRARTRGVTLSDKKRRQVRRAWIILGLLGDTPTRRGQRAA